MGLTPTSGQRQRFTRKAHVGPWVSVPAVVLAALSNLEVTCG